MQQGDTFQIRMQYKEQGSAAVLPAQNVLYVGVYNHYGKLLLNGSTADGRVAYVRGEYILNVTHAESLAMVGDIFIELTIVSRSSVMHADKVVAAVFEPRRNNNII